MANTQPQVNLPMQAYGSPQPQYTAAGGGVQPQSPVMSSPAQPQNPVATSNIQPQAIAPMQVHSKVYGDHGANNRPLGPDGKRDWTYGLCDCFSRCGLCCSAWWCPCIVFSKTRQRLRSLQYDGQPLAGEGDTWSAHCGLYTLKALTGRPWMMQLQPRVEMRERYAIRGNLFKDCLASAFCTACALTQERREVEVEEAAFHAVQQVVQVTEK